MSTVRRNPVTSFLASAKKTATAVGANLQKTATAVGAGVQRTATAVGTNLSRTATTVHKNAQKTAATVQKNLQKTATTVSTKTKAALDATKDGFQHVRNETKKATEESGWQKLNSKIEAKEGKLEVGGTKGFGSKMDEAATLKDFKTKGTGKRTAEWVDEPEAKTTKDKAKKAGKEVLDSVGVRVFDPEKAKFEKDWDATSIKTKRVNADTVDKQGYDTGYRVLSAYADGKGNITVGKKTNIEGKIEAGAVLVQASVEGKTKLGKTGLEATGKAEGTVGVTGSASGNVRVDLFSKKPTVKVQAGVEAFAGAKVSAEGRIGNDYAGVGAKAEGWAGIGAKAKADVGIEGGRFKAKVELGAALGIGGSVSFSVDVNYQKAIDSVVGTGKKAVENITNAGTAVVKGAGNLVSSGWNTVSGWFR